MAKVIAAAIQKGGTGKSTLVFILARLLASRGRRVLAIDLDPQSSLTRSFGIEKPPTTSYDMLSGKPYTVYTVAENCDLVASSQNLAAIELEALGKPKWGYMLDEALGELADSYDYIIIDSPPSLGVLTTNAVLAADGVIVPVQTQEEAYEGLGLLLNTMSGVLGRGKKLLDKVIAIQPTQYDGRTLHHREILELLRHNYGGRVTQPVKDSVSYADAAHMHQPIYQFNSKLADPWNELADRVEEWSGLEVASAYAR